MLDFIVYYYLRSVCPQTKAPEEMQSWRVLLCESHDRIRAGCPVVKCELHCNDRLLSFLRVMCTRRLLVKTVMAKPTHWASQWGFPHSLILSSLPPSPYISSSPCLHISCCIKPDDYILLCKLFVSVIQLVSLAKKHLSGYLFLFLNFCGVKWWTLHYAFAGTVLEK